MLIVNFLLGKPSKKNTVNLMTSGLKVGGGLFQNMISKMILMMTSQGGGWGSEINVIIKNSSENPYFNTNFTNFSYNLKKISTFSVLYTLILLFVSQIGHFGS